MVGTFGFPFQEASLYEIQKFSEKQQDITNFNAIPAARLGQLTFNINRGADSAPLESYTSFLPFPHRFEAASQAEKVENISKEAAQDFAKYYPELSYKVKQAFASIKLGLFDKAKK